MRSEVGTCTSLSPAGWPVASNRRRMASITASGQPLATNPEHCGAHIPVVRLFVQKSPRHYQHKRLWPKEAARMRLLSSQQRRHSLRESDAVAGLRWRVMDAAMHDTRGQRRTVMHEESLIIAAASSAVTKRSRSRAGCAALHWLHARAESGRRIGVLRWHRRVVNRACARS